MPNCSPRTNPFATVRDAVTGHRPRAAHPIADPDTVVQNPLGDLVVPVDDGEVVSLPRLWGFTFAAVGDRSGVMTTSIGLTARLEIEGESVTVVELAERTQHRTEVVR